MLWAVPLCTVEAEDKSYNASYVKAAYIKKLISFVEWPHPSDSYKICVLGDDLVGTSLGAIATPLKDSLKLIIEKVKLSEDFSHCNVLFIGDSQEKLLALAISKAEKFPILTVSDIESSLIKGVVIEFIAIEDSIKIGVNRVAAKQVSLKLSSSLLGVAYKMVDHVGTP